MPTKQTYAVSVGVSRYQSLKPLSCPDADARDVAEVLRDSATSAHVRLLVDAEATKGAILGGLGWVAESAGAGDTALVYFSGHGGRQEARAGAHAYFCPVEASLAECERTCVSSDELTAALRSIKSERLVVLLDTCHAGGIGEPRHRGNDLDAGLTERDVTALIEGSGRMILAASRPDELAWDDDAKRNGMFTSYLLRGLRGEAARADGTVWASDLFSYVSRSVRGHRRRPDRRQHPYQKVIGEDFVVTVSRKAASPPAQVAAAHPRPEIDQRQLRLAMRRAYNRAELSLLCCDLGLSLEDLPGTTLETQLMELIDHCQRHGLDKRLLERVRAERPQLALS